MHDLDRKNCEFLIMLPGKSSGNLLKSKRQLYVSYFKLEVKFTLQVIKHTNKLIVLRD